MQSLADHIRAVCDPSLRASPPLPSPGPAAAVKPSAGAPSAVAPVSTETTPSAEVELERAAQQLSLNKDGAPAFNAGESVPGRSIPSAAPMADESGAATVTLDDGVEVDYVGQQQSTVVSELVQLRVPKEALYDQVVWFNHTPPADRRSATIQPAKCTISELQSALLHRERRRLQKIAVESCVLSVNTLLTYLRYGNGQKRVFASNRGNFHIALMEWRYDLVAQNGDLRRTCNGMMTTLTDAVRMVNSLRSVEEEVATLANHAVASDAVFYKMLKVVEYELLPSGDSDDSVLLEVEWHPTNGGSNVVRTAYALVSKLRSLASSNQQGGNDALILRYFRIHVEKARTLSNLVLDSTRRSLPDLIYDAYLTNSRRAEYDTVSRLATALKEPSSIGFSPLLFNPSEDSRRRPLQLPPSPPRPEAGADHDE